MPGMAVKHKGMFYQKTGPGERWMLRCSDNVWRPVPRRAGIIAELDEVIKDKESKSGNDSTSSL